MNRNDPRPICWCNAYSFPHKIGGKCTGRAFVEFYLYNIKEHCHQCNCLNDSSCDVVEGRESIKESECYQERLHSYPGERLPITFEDITNEY